MLLLARTPTNIVSFSPDLKPMGQDKTIFKVMYKNKCVILVVHDKWVILADPEKSELGDEKKNR